MDTILWHAPISSAERRAASADSCELKSFLQRDSDLRARWAPGRLAWQEHQGRLKQASCLFLSQDTFCPMLSCSIMLTAPLHFSSGITSHLLPCLISLGCRQRWLSRKMESPLCQCFPPALKFIYPHHSWTWPDLHYQPSSSSRSHTSHPSHLSFLFSFCKHTVLSSLLWMELLWSFNC